jgi:hypothetical protein
VGRDRGVPLLDCGPCGVPEAGRRQDLEVKGASPMPRKTRAFRQRRPFSDK